MWHAPETMDGNALNGIIFKDCLLRMAFKGTEKLAR